MGKYMPNIYIYIYCIIWLLLLGLQNLGFWEFLRRKTDTQAVFLPGATAVIQISLLFFAGILNLLPQATALLWAFGIGFFFYCWWKDKGLSFLRNYISFPYLYLFLFSVIFLVFLHGKKLAHIDNFSHWSVVVKAILQKNRFPNFLEERYLEFQEYPVGSAIYIYYCMRFSGTPSSEWKMMFSQSYLYLAFLLPIFRKNSKKQMPVFLLMVLFTNFVMVFLVSITELLVDRLLVLAGMCMLWYIIEHSGAEKLTPSSFLITAAFLVANSQIKNSSVFFVAIACVLILWAGKADKQWVKRFSLGGIAVLAYVVWNRHCKLVYSAPDYSSHAMNASRYISILSQRNAGEILTLAKEMFLFVVENSKTWMFVVSILVTGTIVFLGDRQKFPTYRRQACIVTVCLLAYLLGTLAMYVVSMSTIEIENLASIERYYSTIILAAMCWVCYCFSSVLDGFDWEKYRKMEIAISLCILVFFPFLQAAFKIQGIFVPKNQTYTYEMREPMDRTLALIGDNYPNENYTFINPDRDLYYYLLMRYLCPESSIRFISSEKPIDEQGIDTYYCIVLDWDSDYVRQWVQEGKYVRVGDWLMERAE